jgi:hypothetical protein
MHGRQKVTNPIKPPVIVELAQELAELVPVEMSRLGNAEGILTDLVNWAERNVVFSQATRTALVALSGSEEVLEFEEIIDRARALIGKVRR